MTVPWQPNQSNSNWKTKLITNWTIKKQVFSSAITFCRSPKIKWSIAFLPIARESSVLKSGKDRDGCTKEEGSRIGLDTWLTETDHCRWCIDSTPCHAVDDPMPTVIFPLPWTGHKLEARKCSHYNAACTSLSIKQLRFEAFRHLASKSRQ